MVGIIGGTGSAKSSLVNLISRLYDVTSGEIDIDGMDIRKMTQKSLRRNIGIVQQDVYLFVGTVYDNIRYGKLDATSDEIKRAIKTVRAEDFIENMGGLSAPIIERGASLSQGQRQLIAFARTLLSDPKILILDEATSAIDAKTEKLLQDGLDMLLKGRTSFIIAHRLSTIRDADVILVMKDGDIIEQGNHKQLLAQNGFYAQLYNSQFEG